MNTKYAPVMPAFPRLDVIVRRCQQGLDVEPADREALNAAAPALAAALYRLVDVVVWAAENGGVVRGDHPAVRLALATLSQVAP